MVYEMPEGYKEAVSAPTREIDVFISVGTEIDATAADDITSIEGSFLPMSNPSQIVDANYQMTEWMATFEGDGIVTSADYGNLAPPLEATEYPPEVGVWSDVISDADGNIDWSLTVNLSAVHESAFTVYTYGTHILEAEVSFYVDDELQGTEPMESYQGYISESRSYQYNRIVLHVSRLVNPYHHVKIVEIEFGASIAYNKKKLTGVVNLTQEIDTTMLSLPLYQLDFEILNVTGEYDQDNPTGQFADLRTGYPAEMSVTFTHEGAQYTVPCGRYVIADKVASDTSLTITCYDPRLAFSENYSQVTLKTSQSFGDYFAALFADLHIPYEIDEAVFDIYPDKNITFDTSQYDMLSAMLCIEQYFDIWLIPSRNGTIKVMAGLTQGEYGLYPPELMYSYPLPSSFQSYNCIQVAYGTDGQSLYELDLRQDVSEAKSQAYVQNPLITTQAKAIEIAGKIASAMISAQVETECRADPAIDMNDNVSLEGKWSAGNPTTYKLIYQELSYDGSLTTRLRTVNR